MWDRRNSSTQIQILFQCVEPPSQNLYPTPLVVPMRPAARLTALRLRPNPLIIFATAHRDSYSITVKTIQSVSLFCLAQTVALRPRLNLRENMYLLHRRLHTLLPHCLRRSLCRLIRPVDPPPPHSLTTEVSRAVIPVPTTNSLCS